MDVHEYFNQMREVHSLLLTFINNGDNLEDNYHFLINFIEDSNISSNKNDLTKLIRLIMKVSKNIHRKNNFFNKIEQLLNYLRPCMEQFFSNEELFFLFRNNKWILLLLIQKDIIIIDDFIFGQIIKTSHSKGKEYFFYFWTEIKSFYNFKNQLLFEEELLSYDSNILHNFEEKRKLGENESYICELIRNDSIDEFITYVSQTNTPISQTIKRSIFETNPFLLKNQGKTTYIEYAAFFGSIQILQYLRLNDIELKPSLWLYSIHGENAEMIHFLEQNRVSPPENDKSYEKCLEEAIKCHHNNIAVYIQSNLLNERIESNNLQNNFNKNSISYCFHYLNFELFPEAFDNKYIFYYACRYGFLNLVEFLYENNEINLKEKIKIDIQK